VRALDVAVAAVAGIETCSVRQPRLKLLGSSNPATKLLASLAGHLGAVVERVENLEASEFLGGGADIAVVVGPGAAVISELGEAGSVVAGRLALRPGEGVGCGVCGASPVLWCPARLETALALALAVMKPCIDHLAATREPPFGVDARSPEDQLGAGLRRNRAAAPHLGRPRTPGGGGPDPCGDRGRRRVAYRPAESEGFAAGETVFALGRNGLSGCVSVRGRPETR
jgi:hypothetical protein